MLETPRQDWSRYEALSRDAQLEWLRSLSPSDALSLYENLHRFAGSLPDDPRELERREAARWQEKLALRKRLHAAFVALDRVRHG